MATLSAGAGHAVGLSVPDALLAYCLAFLLVAHGSGLLNVWGHRWGRKSHPTRDHSRNSLALALISFGEGWHNNHHHHPGSCRFGKTWREPDPGYWLVKTLGRLGLAWDIRVAPSLHKARRPSATDRQTDR